MFDGQGGVVVEDGLSVIVQEEYGGEVVLVETYSCAGGALEVNFQVEDIGVFDVDEQVDVADDQAVGDEKFGVVHPVFVGDGQVELVLVGLGFEWREGCD